LHHTDQQTAMNCITLVDGSDALIRLARLSGLVFHRSHRCIDMAYNALEYIFAAALDAPH
jgi:hypothetical protein